MAVGTNGMVYGYMNKVEIKKVNWQDISKEFCQVHPHLAKMIDNIDPGKNLPVLHVTYPFGAKILEDGKLLLLDDARNNPEITDLISYSPIPLGLFLNKACETFIEIQNRIIPIFVLRPGNTIGLFETLDTLCSVKSTPIWNVTAGARSIFMLAKINNALWHKRLIRHFNINAATPKVLTDQWDVFVDIANSKNADANWHCDMVFFTKNWIERLLKEKSAAWVQLREFLYKECWLLSRAMQDKSFAFGWQHFASSTRVRNYKPRIYITDTIRHLISVGYGLEPAFAPATTEVSAPIKLIKQAYHEIYDLPYAPTLIEPAVVQENGKPVYYSLGYPSLLEGYPETANIYNTISDLKEIKLLIENMQKFCNKKLPENNRLAHIVQQIQFDYFHKVTDKHAEIKESQQVIELDKNFSETDPRFSNKDFCDTSPFLNGCIQIARKIAE